MSRRRVDADGTEKTLARQKIINFFSEQSWPKPLHILTLPGLEWKFEQQLLAVRQKSPTHFTSCENNHETFLRAVKTKPQNCKFIFVDVDVMMANESEKAWDAAWLDYCGPLSSKRLQIIKRFYEGFIRNTLIITALKTRWRLHTGITIDRAGGHSQWLIQHLKGEILHDFEYLDTTPMVQFAVRHNKPFWGLYD
jgi:hypothetical protein